MIKHIALLFFLSIGVSHADDAKHFADIPKNITTEEAIHVVVYVAEHYKWTALRPKNEINKLRINLDHRGYRAVLDFTFTGNEITYLDSTKIPTEIDDEFDARYGEEVWVASNVPPNWLANLQRGTKKQMKNLKRDTREHIVIDEIKNIRTETADSIEKKLEGLNNLRKKGLITQKEYNLKKKDILSRY